MNIHCATGITADCHLATLGGLGFTSTAGYVKAADIAPDVGFRTFFHAEALGILRGHILGAGGHMGVVLLRTQGIATPVCGLVRNDIGICALGTFIVALVGFHCFCIAAGIVMSAVLMGAEELVAAIVTVYLHLAYMGAGSTLGGRGITAGIITGGMSAGLTLNRCHVAAVPGVVTFGVSLGIGAGVTCHGFYIAAVLVMDMAAGNFSGSLAVAAVAMDMVAIQLHGDAPVIYGAFMGAAISTFFAAGM